jgi:hypothetical protein
MYTDKKNGMQYEKKTPPAPRQFRGGDVKTVGLVEENGQEKQDWVHISQFYEEVEHEIQIESLVEVTEIETKDFEPEVPAMVIRFDVQQSQVQLKIQSPKLVARAAEVDDGMSGQDSEQISRWEDLIEMKNLHQVEGARTCFH